MCYLLTDWMLPLSDVLELKMGLQRHLAEEGAGNSGLLFFTFCACISRCVGWQQVPLFEQPLRVFDNVLSLLKGKPCLN